jgi:hypothetical protein
MEPLGGTRGQASAEYVVLVALVAVVLALAAGLTSGGIGGQVLAGLQRGLCRVTGAACPRPEPVRPDLAPCPVDRSVSREQLSGTVFSVQLGTDGTLSVARGSDGRVTVTIAHGNTAGAQIGAGAVLRLGKALAGRDVQAGAGVAWSSGRSWDFANAAAADRFVAIHGSKATIGGQAVDELRSGCSLLCDAIGWRPHAQLPEPDETYAEAGATAQLTASLGLDWKADASAILGRKRGRDGATTWYLQLDAATTASLGLTAVASSGSVGGEAVLAYGLDPHGRPRSLDVQLTGGIGADLQVDRAYRAAGLTAAGGAGGVVELEAGLDLREAANRTAAAGLLAALTDLDSSSALPARARALAQRIAEQGQLDRRVYALTRTATGYEGGAALGIKVGGGFEHTTRGLRLLSAETRLPGLPFLPRDDCRPA